MMAATNRQAGFEVDKTTTDLRVDEIVEKMTKSEWCPGPSHRELAKKWSVTPATVEKHAAEASRLIRRLVGQDREALRAMVFTGLQTLITEARAQKQYGPVVKAYELQCRVLGLMAPTEMSVTATVAAMTEEQLEAREAILVAQLMAEAKRSTETCQDDAIPALGEGVPETEPEPAKVEEPKAEPEEKKPYAWLRGWSNETA